MSPCDAETDFTTPRELGVIHLHNLACIDSYEASLQSLRDWKSAKNKLYNIKK